MQVGPETPWVSRQAPGASATRGARRAHGRRPGATRPSGSARLAALALAAAALACEPYVQGNGVYLEVQRTPGPFAGVHVDDGIAGTVTVVSGPGYSVVVSGDANLLDYVRTEVQLLDLRGEAVDVLHVWVDEPGAGYDGTIPIRATIEVPALRYVGAIGASRVEAREVAAAELDVESRGGSFLDVRGSGGTDLHAVAEGSTLDLGSWLASTYAEVTATGRSHVEVAATGTLTGEARDTSVVQNLATAAVCDLVADPTATGPCVLPAGP
jgi:hypothetical protein